MQLCGVVDCGPVQKDVEEGLHLFALDLFGLAVAFVGHIFGLVSEPITRFRSQQISLETYRLSLALPQLAHHCSLGEVRVGFEQKFEADGVRLLPRESDIQQIFEGL